MSMFNANPDFFSDAAALKEAAYRRISRRSYLGSALSPDNKAAILETAGHVSSMADGVQVAIDFERGKQIFDMLGLFSTIKKPPCTAAFIVNSRDPYCYEKCGYFGEAFVLAVTARGFDTCWVTGTYSKSGTANAFSTTDSDIVAAVTPVGFASGSHSAMEQITTASVSGRNRRSQSEILPTYHSAPDWVRDAIDCARIAPSAINGQPWNFDMVNGELCLVRPDTGSTNKRIDVGIAMFHVSIAAKVLGVNGSWEPMDGRYLARFAVV